MDTNVITKTPDCQAHSLEDLKLNVFQLEYRNCFSQKPTKVTESNVLDVLERDHSPVLFKGGYRRAFNYEHALFIPFGFTNPHNENEVEWHTIESVYAMFEQLGINALIYVTRDHMRTKCVKKKGEGKFVYVDQSPRPRIYVACPLTQPEYNADRFVKFCQWGIKKLKSDTTVQKKNIWLSGFWRQKDGVEIYRVFSAGKNIDEVLNDGDLGYEKKQQKPQSQWQKPQLPQAPTGLPNSVDDLKIEIYPVVHRKAGGVSNILFKNEPVTIRADNVLYYLECDHSPINFKDGYKHADNYQHATYIPFFVNNSHSENEAEWVTFDDVYNMFVALGVNCVIYTAQGHMTDTKFKRKVDGETLWYKGSPRPQFHVLCPLATPETDIKKYIRFCQWGNKRLGNNEPFTKKNLQVFGFGHKREGQEVYRVFAGGKCIDQVLTDADLCKPKSQKSNAEEKIWLVQLNEIEVLENNSVDEKNVEALKESMAVNGLMCPVLLTHDYRAVAGRNRIEAAKRLGWKEIPCRFVEGNNLKLELFTIDENIVRKELDSLTRGELAMRRDEILEQLGLRAKVGDNQHTIRGRTPGVLPQKLKTTEELAAEANVSESTLKEDKRLAKKLIPEAKNAVREKTITKKAGLEMSRHSPEVQAEMLAEILSDDSQKFEEMVSEETEKKTKKSADKPSTNSTIGKTTKDAYDNILDRLKKATDNWFNEVCKKCKKNGTDAKVVWDVVTKVSADLEAIQAGLNDRANEFDKKKRASN